MNALLTLLQINDSAFPIGSFTQSYGLETYVSMGIVKDSKAVKVYAETMLKHNFYYNDAAFFMMAWKMCDSNATKARVQELDDLISAYKAPFEIRDASKKLGIRFLKVTENLKPIPRCTKYLHAIKSGELHGHYAMAFAMYAHAAKIPMKDALHAFYYNTLNGIVTNCAKLVPISQMDAQKILYNLHGLIDELVEKQESMPEELLGSCCIAQDIRCMQHEKLYTRIYIS